MTAANRLAGVSHHTLLKCREIPLSVPVSGSLGCIAAEVHRTSVAKDAIGWSGGALEDVSGVACGALDDATNIRCDGVCGNC